MKDRSSLRHNANAAKRPQCGTAGDHPGAAQTTGVRHVNLGNRIGSRASAAAGFSSDRPANCERRPSRAVLSRRCATRCGCLSEAGRTNQPSPEMQGHDPRQGDGQKDTEKKRSGNQGGQHGERRHHSPSLTHDCVAPRRGQVHDFAQGADRPRPQCSSASRFTAGACGFMNLSRSGERPDRYRDPSRLQTMPPAPSCRRAGTRHGRLRAIRR